MKNAYLHRAITIFSPNLISFDRFISGQPNLLHEILTLSDSSGILVNPNLQQLISLVRIPQRLRHSERLHQTFNIN